MSDILDAFEIRWQPLLGCVGLGLLWCQDKDERKMVMGAGAVLVVALGRIATDGADWMSLTAVCSVAGYTLFERFTKLPGKMEPEGVWTAPTKAAKPSEGRKAHARLCAGGQVYSGDPPKAVDHTVGDAIVIEAVAAAGHARRGRVLQPPQRWRARRLPGLFRGDRGTLTAAERANANANANRRRAA